MGDGKRTKPSVNVRSAGQWTERGGGGGQKYQADGYGYLSLANQAGGFTSGRVSRPMRLLSLDAGPDSEKYKARDKMDKCSEECLCA